MHEGAMPGFEGLYIPMFSPPCQNNTDALQRNLKGIKEKKRKKKDRESCCQDNEENVNKKSTVKNNLRDKALRGI